MERTFKKPVEGKRQENGCTAGTDQAATGRPASFSRNSGGMDRKETGALSNTQGSSGGDGL